MAKYRIVKDQTLNSFYYSIEKRYRFLFWDIWLWVDESSSLTLKDAESKLSILKNGGSLRTKTIISNE